MGDAARDLGAGILRAIQEAAASNTQAIAPAWVTLSCEAARRGMTTSAMRAWCHRHKVVIREGSHKDAWVQPLEVDRAIEGLPPARRPVLGDDIDRAIDARTRK